MAAGADREVDSIETDFGSGPGQFSALKELQVF
jgi:hypothetical protein